MTGYCVIRFLDETLFRIAPTELVKLNDNRKFMPLSARDLPDDHVKVKWQDSVAGSFSSDGYFSAEILAIAGSVNTAKAKALELRCKLAPNPVLALPSAKGVSHSDRKERRDQAKEGQNIPKASANVTSKDASKDAQSKPAADKSKGSKKSSHEKVKDGHAKLKKKKLRLNDVSIERCKAQLDLSLSRNPLLKDIQGKSCNPSDNKSNRKPETGDLKRKKSEGQKGKEIKQRSDGSSSAGISGNTNKKSIISSPNEKQPGNLILNQEVKDVPSRKQNVRENQGKKTQSSKRSSEPPVPLTVKSKDAKKDKGVTSLSTVSVLKPAKEKHTNGLADGADDQNANKDEAGDENGTGTGACYKAEREDGFKINDIDTWMHNADEDEWEMKAGGKDGLNNGGDIKLDDNGDDVISKDSEDDDNKFCDYGADVKSNDNGDDVKTNDNGDDVETNNIGDVKLNDEDSDDDGSKVGGSDSENLDETLPVLPEVMLNISVPSSSSSSSSESESESDSEDETSKLLLSIEQLKCELAKTKKEFEDTKRDMIVANNLRIAQREELVSLKKDHAEKLKLIESLQKRNAMIQDMLCESTAGSKHKKTMKADCGTTSMPKEEVTEEQGGNDMSLTSTPKKGLDTSNSNIKRHAEDGQSVTSGKKRKSKDANEVDNDEINYFCDAVLQHLKKEKPLEEDNGFVHLGSGIHVNKQSLENTLSDNTGDAKKICKDLTALTWTMKQRLQRSLEGAKTNRFPNAPPKKAATPKKVNACLGVVKAHLLHTGENDGPCLRENLKSARKAIGYKFAQDYNLAKKRGDV